jgi:hypothetical protein
MCLGGHIDALLVDGVRVLEAADAVADRRFAGFGRAGVDGDRHSEQPCGGGHGLYLIVEPGRLPVRAPRPDPLGRPRHTNDSAGAIA